MLGIRKQYSLYIAAIIGGLFFTYGCSTKKNGWAHRTYHNTTTRYNGYFNAKEIIRTKVAAFEISREDNYSLLLPVFEFGTNEERQSLFPDMETAIEKATKMISRHSIEIRGKQYVRWIDNCYYVIGQAHFYKGEMDKAKEMFNYVSKKFKDEDTKNLAMLYLVRVYLDEKNFERAENLLRLAESQPMEKKELAMLRLVYADMFIRQKNYKLAIPELKQAVPLIRKKRHRVRIVYLLGQLYKQEGDYAMSTQMFEQVVKMHPDYKMTFYAKIQMAMAYNGQPGGKEEVRKQLLKMLSDEKYTEFKDQIYYALAMMEYQDNDIPETLDLLKKSTEVSVSNDQQKALSFLKMGEIHFDNLEYENAQVNYDSCVQFLSPEYQDYEEVIKLRENLNDLVEQITIINHQDSLQRLAKMSPKERLKAIEDEIDRRKEEEEEKRRQKQLQKQLEEGGGFPTSAIGGGPGGIGGPGIPGIGGNQWYFYNASARAQGAGEFKRLWGGRKNEDDWRRSNKNTISIDPDEIADEGSSEYYVDENGDTVKTSQDWHDPSYYMKDIPLKDDQLLASNKKMLNAYYKLANIYWDQMEDNLKTIETLENMNKRFDTNKYQLPSYYSLYRLHGEEDHTTEEDYYRNKILKEYPNTDYAKLIIDPEYFKKENIQNQDVLDHYNTVYGYYNRGFYEYTIESCDKAMVKYADSPIKPKFALLRAMSYGQTGGKAGLIAELQKLQVEYAGHEVAKKASEIMVQLNVAEELRKQEAAKKEMEDKFPYKYDPDSKHNFIILLPRKLNNSRVLKSKIQSFNTRYFKSDKLKLSSVLLGDDYQMVTIQSFRSASRVLKYIETFKNAKKVLSGVNNEGYAYFGISYDNYPLFYKEQNVKQYMEFFKLNYAQ